MICRLVAWRVLKNIWKMENRFKIKISSVREILISFSESIQIVKIHHSPLGLWVWCPGVVGGIILLHCSLLLRYTCSDLPVASSTAFIPHLMSPCRFCWFLLVKTTCTVCGSVVPRGTSYAAGTCHHLTSLCARAFIEILLVPYAVSACYLVCSLLRPSAHPLT